jgi:hypothetical protein
MVSQRNSVLRRAIAALSGAALLANGLLFDVLATVGAVWIVYTIAGLASRGPWP